MKLSLKALIALLIAIMIATCVGIVYFSRAERQIMPSNATDFHSKNVCGSSYCIEYSSFNIVQTTDYMVQFYQARGFQCEKIASTAYQLFPQIPLPYWQCKKKVDNDAIIVGFAIVDTVNLNTPLRVYGTFGSTP